MADNSLEAFEQEAQAFLDGHASRREEERAFVWGQGSDKVTLFDEKARDREREELRAAFGSSAPVARRVKAPLDELETFPEQVAEAASPIDDVRGTAAYRRHALRVLTRRALERCLA